MVVLWQKKPRNTAVRNNMSWVRVLRCWGCPLPMWNGNGHSVNSHLFPSLLICLSSLISRWFEYEHPNTHTHAHPFRMHLMSIRYCSRFFHKCILTDWIKGRKMVTYPLLFFWEVAITLKLPYEEVRNNTHFYSHWWTLPAPSFGWQHREDVKGCLSPPRGFPLVCLPWALCIFSHRRYPECRCLNFGSWFLLSFPASIIILLLSWIWLQWLFLGFK